MMARILIKLITFLGYINLSLQFVMKVVRWPTYVHRGRLDRFRSGLNICQ